MRLALAAVAFVVAVGPGWAQDNRQGLDAIISGKAVDGPPEFNIVHFCNWRTDHQTSGMSNVEADAYTQKCITSEAQSYEDIRMRWRAVDYRVKVGCVTMHSKDSYPSYASLDECILDR